MDKIGQSGGFLGRILGPLLKTVSPLIGNVLKPLAKRVLISLELTAAASATDAAIHKKIFGSGMTTLIISNEKMNDIRKIVKSFEKKEEKGGSLNLLLGELGASLKGNLLTGKRITRAGEDAIRAGFLMPPYSLTKFEIQKYR